MKIVFDNIIFALQSCGGISVVWSHLLQHILPKGDEIAAIEYEGGLENFSRRELGMENVNIHTKSSRLLPLRRFIDLRPANIGAQDEPYIFHSSYYRLCRDPKAVCITTVHDFAYYLHVSNPLLRFIHCRQQSRAIRKADYVVCISESTRAELFRILPDFPEEKVRVICNGVSEVFRPLEGVTREDFALYVGNRDRYKNFDALMEPLGKLGKRLVIVGPELTESELENLRRHRVNYEHRGVITDEDLNLLYNRADCLIYPSMYEGFGLPVVEAQKAGCPVIATNTSSLPEVIGDPKMLMSELSFQQLEERLEWLKNPDIREEIVRKGIESAGRFSWEKMAEDYYSLYREALTKQ